MCVRLFDLFDINTYLCGLKCKSMLENNSQLRKYKLTQKKIAKFMGYRSAQAFRNSTAKARILHGIEKILLYIEEK